MQKLKQTIILSGNGNEVATLTLEKNINGVIGNLKLFNANFKDDLMLGISNNGKEVLKHNVSFVNGNTYSFKLNKLDNFENIGVVLVQKQNNQFVPLLWGKQHNFKDKILAEFNDSYLSGVNNVVKSNLKVNKESSNNVEELFESDEKEIENLINKELKDIDNCNYDNNTAVETSGVKEQDIEEDVEENTEDEELEENSTDIFAEENKKLGNFDGNDFFELISEQIDDLFDNYPRLNELEELVPNSKWVKIDFENNGNEYVLGLIYDGFDLKYICYGVPGAFNSVPPKQLGECQWLPLDPKNPTQGYWVIYQDAITGDKVDII